LSYLSIQKDDLFKRIKQRNQELNHYDYGFIYKGKKESENFDHYRTISPEDFEKHKLGVCWDYVEQEARDFKSFGFKNTNKPLEDMQFSLYYICHTTEDGINPTHTWLGFKYNGNVYAFESSWLSHQGIHKFKDEKSMISTYAKWHKSGIKSKIINQYIIKYAPRIKFGKTPQQYMNDIHYSSGIYYSTTDPKYKNKIKYRL